MHLKPTRLRHTLLLACVTLCFVAGNKSHADASGYRELVASAFEKLQRGNRDDWSYTETRSSNEQSHIARYHADRPEGERWQLELLNGAEPTAAQIAEFLDDKQPDDETEESDNGDNDFANLDTLSLIEETDAHWRFAFEPLAETEKDAAFMEHVDGELTVQKDGRYVSKISMRNNGPIKPATGVKIVEFSSDFEFAPLTDEGPIAPQKMDIRVRGRAFLAVRINEQETIRYSDFERVSD